MSAPKTRSSSYYRWPLIAVMALSLFMLSAIAPTEAAARNFLWRLKSPQGGQAYIMGSIHLAHQGLYPLNKEVMDAFGEANLLVVEINSEDMNPALMARFIQDHGFVSDKPPLPERLAEKTREALKNSGLYEAGMARMAPWLAALTIQVEVLNDQGFRAEYGLDTFFINRAKERKLRILELETLEQQMGMLTEMSAEEADLFLFSTLVEMDELPKVMRNFLGSWQNGDIDAFAEAFFEEYHKYPELKPLLDLIIFRRNQEMAAKIEDLMFQEDGFCFIVVGAGHLVGDRSILAELQSRGWQAEQL